MAIRTWAKWEDDDFDKVKARKVRGAWDWDFLLRGEGDDDQYHQWDYCLSFGKSAKGCWFALKELLPRPVIYVVAEVTEGESRDAVIKAMLGRLNRIDILDDWNRDFEFAMSNYLRPLPAKNQTT